MSGEERTPIRIEGPLPLGVAGALMQAIGTMWPEATINTMSRGYALDMSIPKNGKPEDLDQEFLDELAKEAVGEAGDAEFRGFDDGWVAITPPEELCLHLGHIAHSIFTAHQPAAVNHVEWEVKTGDEQDDPRYVLSVSIGKDKTPLAMRKQAEAEVERLKALLDANGVAY